MDKFFFDNLKGKKINVTYREADNLTFTEGKVKTVGANYVVVTNSYCDIAIIFDSITSCKIKSGEVNHA